MRFGLGRLRLAPASFWAMTPREMAAAMRGMVPEEPNRLDRARMRDLMESFPDSEAGEPRP